MRRNGQSRGAPPRSCRASERRLAGPMVSMGTGRQRIGSAPSSPLRSRCLAGTNASLGTRNSREENTTRVGTDRSGDGFFQAGPARVRLCDGNGQGARSAVDHPACAQRCDRLRLLGVLRTPFLEFDEDGGVVAPGSSRSSGSRPGGPSRTALTNRAPSGLHPGRDLCIRRANDGDRHAWMNRLGSLATGEYCRVPHLPRLLSGDDRARECGRGCGENLQPCSRETPAGRHRFFCRRAGRFSRRCRVGTAPRGESHDPSCHRGCGWREAR